MADDYFSDTPISTPLYIPTISADVDLNGLSFSYEIGLMFTPNSVSQPLKLPPPFQGNNL